MVEHEDGLWFERKEGGLGIAAVAWQGKFATALYLVLVVFAVFIYSSLSLIVLVVLIYTMIFAFVVVMKSDLLKDRQPPEE